VPDIDATVGGEWSSARWMLHQLLSGAWVTMEILVHGHSCARTIVASASLSRRRKMIASVHIGSGAQECGQPQRARMHGRVSANGTVLALQPERSIVVSRLNRGVTACRHTVHS
jgi:hypothetical protein